MRPAEDQLDPLPQLNATPPVKRRHPIHRPTIHAHLADRLDQVPLAVATDASMAAGQVAQDRHVDRSRANRLAQRHLVP